EHYWIPQIIRKNTGWDEREVWDNTYGICKQLETSDNAGYQAQEPYELMTFEEIWQEQDCSNISSTKMKAVVCFVSDQQNREVVFETVQAINRNAEIVFVSQGEDYRKLSPQGYSIVKTEQADYLKVFKGIGEDYVEIDAVLYLWALEDSKCTKEYGNIVHILQTVFKAGLKPKRLILAAQFKNGLERCYAESWIGFERSLGLLMPSTQVNAVYREVNGQNSETNIKEFLKKIVQELQVQKGESVLYREGKRYVCRVQPTSVPQGKVTLRDGGTYLITGGCGELGFLFAQHLAEIKPVNLVLTGRSGLDDKKRSRIQRLEATGSHVLYLQANVSDETCMKEELRRVREYFGTIHGVIHAAGIEGSQSIFEKGINSFTEIMEPKVKGTILLDELLREEAIDFTCYFSSSSAILGDFGSCDYAVANRFQMTYAHYRRQQSEQGMRNGKTFVINWPLWEEGGMGVGDEGNKRMYLKSSGQRTLETGEGLNLFEGVLAQEKTQQLVLVGQRSRIYRFLGLAEACSGRSNLTGSVLPGKGRRAEMKGLEVGQCLEWDLKELTGKLLKISRDKLDMEENLADFGFDSISLAELARVLTEHYGIEITPALFFGYSTLAKLVQYFLTEHQQAMHEFYREGREERAVLQSTKTATPVYGHQILQKSGIVPRSVSTSVNEPIAIIGMSGRFPGARNIDELWDILA
ncbi:MAG TPA: SDR family NAD(P)-dependent oxidoreductase, partial [Ruminiclostridium sp.]|nr:SDR family NAD(P)-dependent oxidoreductase [Ruminiclostridium sp.]